MKGDDIKLKTVLFVYTSESKTGLSSKAEKIAQGFADADFSVDTYHLASDARRSRRVKNLMQLYLLVAWKMIFSRYDVVFMRYAYYFAPLYFVAFVVRSNLQVEVNSNVTAELVARRQKFRAFLDSCTMRFIRFSAKRIHVVSKSLSCDLARRFPKANYIFTPNFVVDENFSRKPDSIDSKINLVFMGNCEQKWHGVSLFLDTMLADGPSWFKHLCDLHFVGNVDHETLDAIERNNLSDVVSCHGALFGEKKHEVLNLMNIGLSSFNLQFKGMEETTAIKTGEYLYNGLGLIIGYKDPVIPCHLPFVLSLNLHGDAKNERRDFRRFLEAYRDLPNPAEAAHQYAKDHLLVDRYIANIVGD